MSQLKLVPARPPRRSAIDHDIQQAAERYVTQQLGKAIEYGMVSAANNYEKDVETCAKLAQRVRNSLRKGKLVNPNSPGAIVYKILQAS
jgi:hypothetical protein